MKKRKHDVLKISNIFYLEDYKQPYNKNSILKKKIKEAIDPEDKHTYWKGGDLLIRKKHFKDKDTHQSIVELKKNYVDCCGWHPSPTFFGLPFESDLDIVDQLRTGEVLLVYKTFKDYDFKEYKSK